MRTGRFDRLRPVPPPHRKHPKMEREFSKITINIEHTVLFCSRIVDV
jgi:hypothetical protein